MRVDRWLLLYRFNMSVAVSLTDDTRFIATLSYVHVAGLVLLMRCCGSCAGGVVARIPQILIASCLLLAVKYLLVGCRPVYNLLLRLSKRRFLCYCVRFRFRCHLLNTGSSLLICRGTVNSPVTLIDGCVEGSLLELFTSDTTFQVLVKFLDMHLLLGCEGNLVLSVPLHAGILLTSLF